MKDNVWNLIKSDVTRYYGNAQISTVLKGYIGSATLRWQIAFRMCNARGGAIKKLGLFLWVLNKNRKIIQIPINTQIGYGLYIAHNGPVIVNSTAIIGNNVNLSQFVTIGANEGKAAIIGDNVYIGPMSCIVENVVLGSNVTIGAGSIVTKNIPDNATAAGNYAKVINYDNPGRYINNRWNDN